MNNPSIINSIIPKKTEASCENETQESINNDATWMDNCSFDVDELVELIENTKPHDAIQLIRIVHGKEETKVRINIYPDNEVARNLPASRSVSSDIRPQVVIGNVPPSDKPTQIPALLEKCNKHGFGIGWMPNPVGNDRKVNKIKCLFVDLDGGKRWESGMKPEPTVVVRSKNGDHLYWLCDDMEFNDARDLMRLLAIHFGGDPAVATPDHVMRLPGFNHCKDENDHFMVHIVHEANAKKVWTKRALLRALGRKVPNYNEWKDYQNWNNAAKILDVEDIGEFNSDKWQSNRKTAIIFQKLYSKIEEYKGNLKVDPPSYDPARSDTYYKGWLTFYRLVDLAVILQKRKLDLLNEIDDLKNNSIKAKYHPDSPEYLLEVEPKLCIYIDYVYSQFREQDKLYEELLDENPNVDYPQIEIKPLNLDDIEISDSTKYSTYNDNSGNTGAWDLRTINWVGLLSEIGIYVQDQGNGWHKIKCPWGELHSDSTKTEAFVSDPNGERPGVYHCFHSHGHKTGDFIKWLVDHFGASIIDKYCRRLPKSIGTNGVVGTPDFPKVVTDKTGKKTPVPHLIENTKAMLNHYNIKLRYNLMGHRQEFEFAGNDTIEEQKNNVGFALVYNLSRKHGLQIEAVKDHLRLITVENNYHPVVNWLKNVKWDGKDHVSKLIESIEIAEGFDKSLAEKLIRTWLITAIKAAFVPANKIEGVAAQGLLVLQGSQGCGKTRWLMSLAPKNSGWAKDGMLIDPSKRDSVQQATAFWIVELGELDATFKKIDIARLKAFVTEKSDVYRTNYDIREENHQRRTIFCGSVNPEEFLVDNTGNRRFWTIPVEKCNPEHGIDLQQLWAQVYQLYASGEKSYLDKETENSLNKSNETFKKEDPMETIFNELFIFSDCDELQRTEIREAMKNKYSSWGQKEDRALGAIMKRIAYENGKKERKSNGKKFWPFQLLDKGVGVNSSYDFSPTFEKPDFSELECELCN